MQVYFALLCFKLGLLMRASFGEAEIPPFKDQCLKWHNVYREKHQVDPVTWSDALASGAESWANYLAQNNLFEHTSGLQVGENLYLSGSPLPEEPCTSATQAFYGEVKDYDFKKPGFSMDTGHFTQVVWKNSKQIGAAQQVRRDGRLVVVIRYNPPGNFNTDGAFAANVLPARLDNGSGVCDVRSPSVFTAYVVALGLIFNFLY
ncbi:unnamed protein product [Pocillopora meandrina]|uniref:SCP domain-containing protein n=1 Tax=Pocillopora meandrina TaxID=46732 RepID=A0AAU9X8Q9_9CNID|nr:unnamed protein product [Pocillopora meandrina]